MIKDKEINYGDIKKFFAICEIFDPETYRKLGEKAWSLLHEDLFITLYQIKMLLSKELPGSKIIINTYSFSLTSQKLYSPLKPFEYRGYRPDSWFFSHPQNAQHSPHRYGLAVDFDVWVGNNLIPASKIRKIIINNLVSLPLLKGIEVNTSWVHIDVMYNLAYRSQQKKGELYVFDSNGWKYNIPIT